MQDTSLCSLWSASLVQVAVSIIRRPCRTVESRIPICVLDLCPRTGFYCAGLRPVPPIRGAVDDDDDSVDDGHDGHDEVDGDVEYATVDDDAGDGEGGV